MADQDGLPEMVLTILSEAPDNRLFTTDELLLSLREYGYHPMPTEAEVATACEKINQRKIKIVMRSSPIVGVDSRVAIGLRRKIKRLPPKAFELPNVKDVPARQKKQVSGDTSLLARLDRFLEKKLNKVLTRIFGPSRNQHPKRKHKNRARP